MDKVAKILPGGVYCDITGFKHTDDYFIVSFMPTEELILHIKSPYVAVVMIYLNSPVLKRKGQKVLDHNSYLTFEAEFRAHNIVVGMQQKLDPNIIRTVLILLMITKEFESSSRSSLIRKTITECGPIL